MNLKKLIAKAIKENPPPPIHLNISKGVDMNQHKQINLVDPIEYHLNESISAYIQPPENFTNLPFEVDQYAGGGHKFTTIEGVAASTYVTVTKTLNSAAVVDALPERWAATSNLKIYPFAGRGLNAYYNRKHLAFFYEKNNETKKWFFTSASPDIVGHELGHALLDALRPDLWNAASLEIWAFHEAFGDIVSMLSIMQYPEIIQKIISQTNGNLRIHNIASDIAENFSKILLANGYNAPNGYLRSGINNYKYDDLQFLPKSGNHNILSKEPHSFSRVFFGAVYDLLVLFYEDLSNQMNPNEALTSARNLLAKYMVKAVKHAPASVRFFESMAKTLLWVDFTDGGIYHDRMYDIFSKRRIINYQFKTLSQNERLGDLSGKIINHGAGMMSICKSKNEKLCNCINHLRSQSSNDLYDVKVSILRTDAYIHDDQGRLLHTHQVPQGESILAAEETIKYLKETNGISDDPNTPFEIKDGELQRTLICCCSGSRKPLSSSPEYFKPYKPENHAGCCGSCKKANKQVKRKIKRGCFVRYKLNK